jgi:NADH-quinone oxidoreductase subunit M
MPVYAALFGFFVFASAGLPGLSGFVGEFLTLVGTFEFSPQAAAIATFVMILAAGYLLYMYGRIVFGELSDFFKSLGDHLTDIEPIEILTLAPLGALVVIFGVQPGLLLNLFSGSVSATLVAADAGTAYEVNGSVVLILVGLLALGIAARIIWVLTSGGRRGSAAAPGTPSAPATEGGAAH